VNRFPFKTFTGIKALDYIKMPLGLDIPAGAEHGAGTVVFVAGVKMPAVPLWRSYLAGCILLGIAPLHGYGSGLGISGKSILRAQSLTVRSCSAKFRAQSLGWPQHSEVMMKKKQYPFKFIACTEVRELLGLHADNEVQLMEMLEDIPPDSIYYHMHSYFLRHVYLAGPYPNDFANWAAVQLRDRVLGEKLAAVTISPQKSIEDIRLEVIEVIDSHLCKTKTNPSATYGSPFHFMKSEIVEIPLQKEARNLSEFTDILRDIHASAIYYHIFEARIRVRRGRNDFSTWLGDIRGLRDLADRIEKIDFYMHSLEGLRAGILKLCHEEMDR
jgi:hypothetical protein